MIGVKSIFLSFFFCNVLYKCSIRVVVLSIRIELASFLGVEAATSGRSRWRHDASNLVITGFQFPFHIRSQTRYMDYWVRRDPDIHLARGYWVGHGTLEFVEYVSCWRYSQIYISCIMFIYIYLYLSYFSLQ